MYALITIFHNRSWRLFFKFAFSVLSSFYLNHADQRLFQFKIIINVLDSSFWFMWIPMFWVYGYYKINMFTLTESNVYRLWRLK